MTELKKVVKDGSSGADIPFEGPLATLGLVIGAVGVDTMGLDMY